MEKIITSKLLGVISIAFLLTGCSNVPSNCTDLITELMQSSFNEASNNDYYIKSVQLMNDSTCYSIGSGYRLTLKKGEWYPCTYTAMMNSNGTLEYDLDIEMCNLSECSTDNSSISTNWEWKDKNISWKMNDISLAHIYLLEKQSRSD